MILSWQKYLSCSLAVEVTCRSGKVIVLYNQKKKNIGLYQQSVVRNNRRHRDTIIFKPLGKNKYNLDEKIGCGHQSRIGSSRRAAAARDYLSTRGPGKNNNLPVSLYNIFSLSLCLYLYTIFIKRYLYLRSCHMHVVDFRLKTNTVHTMCLFLHAKPIVIIICSRANISFSPVMIFLYFAYILRRSRLRSRE